MTQLLNSALEHLGTVAPGFFVCVLVFIIVTRGVARLTDPQHISKQVSEFHRLMRLDRRSRGRPYTGVDRRKSRDSAVPRYVSRGTYWLTFLLWFVFTACSYLVNRDILAADRKEASRDHI